jgi:hypothetical protein
MGRALAGPAPPAWACDSDGVQEGLELGALMPLAGGNQHGQRSAVSVHGEMNLGRQPAPAAPERFATARFDRLV